MAQSKKQYIVIAQINDDDGNSFVVSASVTAPTKNKAIKEASKFNNYDPEDPMVQICAVYEIYGTDVNVGLV